MKRALARANVALLVVLTSPVIALAASNGSESENFLDWLFRLLRWAAGGWHGY
jgi:hypothetical protein